MTEIEKYKLNFFHFFENNFSEFKNIIDKIENSNSILEINSYIVLLFLIKNMLQYDERMYTDDERTAQRKNLGLYWPGRPPDQE